MIEKGKALIRRNKPGTKAKDFHNWPDELFEDMDSMLAVQQYIQQLIRKDIFNVDAILTPPESQDEGVWKYEHLRQFCMDLHGLAVRLQDKCNPETCTQMTASEQWIFLCAAHKTPKECPAIDYTRHTLDGAACLLNSNKYFPSRVSIKESSVTKLGSVCRRVYRIFSHAYYHHREVFDEFEAATYLCHRFSTFVLKYSLMPKENLIVPTFDDPNAIPSSPSPDPPAPSTSADPSDAPSAEYIVSRYLDDYLRMVSWNPHETELVCSGYKVAIDATTDCKIGLSTSHIF